MTGVWGAIVGLTLVTAALRGAGPAILGGRTLPARSSAVISLLAPVLLTALILTRTFDGDGRLVVDARAAGLACAAAAVMLRAPLLVTVLAAAVGAAAVRALT